MPKQTILKIVLAVILAGVTIICSAFDFSTRLIIGISAGVPSIIFIIITRITLGKSYDVVPKAKALVTRGIYSKILHPMYLFIDILFMCIIIITGIPLILIALGVLFTAQVIQSRREEKVLTEAFGNEYIAYKNSTWF